MSAERRERLLELLADRATEGLDPAQQDEVAGLLAEFPDVDADALDRTATALHLAAAPPRDEALPASLRAKLDADAREFFRAREPLARPRARTSAPRRARLWTTASGWAVAAALALVVLMPRPELPPPLAPSPQEARAALLAVAPDVIQLAWSATQDPAAAGASGDVVWSQVRQEGYLRFRGLARNDPAREQYQLWIFDTAQDERFPIDGGVFDVGAGDEVVVPIRAALEVVEPTLFAITVEKPGGVVVSSRERLPLLAKVGT